MKHLYLSLALLLCQLSFAQDSRLFDNPWFLTNVIKNGTDHVPPRGNMGVTFDSPMSMIVQGCLPMMANVTFENNSTNFSATNFQLCLCFCTDSEAEAYEGVYFPFFTPNFELESVQEFTYTISVQGEVKSLIINSMFNEQAIYSSIPLSNESFEKAEFSLSPNPANDFITITYNSQPNPNQKVQIYNTLGKLCKTGHLTSVQTKIETSDLSSGIYFLKIDGREIKKFVKL
jgi:hypothetical protein